MENFHPIAWQTYDHDHHPKSTDWYWAFGIVIALGTTLSFFSNNWLLGIIISLGGSMLFYLSHQTPEVIDIEVNPEGIVVDNNIYRFEKIAAFHFHPVREHVHLLFLTAGRIPQLHYYAIDEGVDIEELYRILEARIEEDETLTEPWINRLLVWLGL